MKDQRILGWDCGTKTLAWTFLQFKFALLVDLVPIMTRLIAEVRGGRIQSALDLIAAAHVICDGIVIHIDSGVVDLIPGKKIAEVSDIDRTKALYYFLNNHKFENIDTVLIESQPPKIGLKVNSSSMAISHQLAYHFIKNNPVFINPRIKNTIWFLYPFEQRPGANYAARKAHSRDNYLYFINRMGWDDILIGISKAAYDDLADSAMQIFAYIRE